MKKLFTLLALTITFSMNAQWSYNSNGSGIQSSSNNASGYQSTAMGGGTTASGSRSTAMGEGSTASGDRSTAMGSFAIASDYSSTVIGQFNSSGSSATSASSFSTSAPAFVIGNGADYSNRSDAFKVMFNGDAYVSSSLYIGGTAITSTASELNYVDGVTSNIQTQINAISSLSLIHI